LENLTLTKNDNANETEIILQTQFTKTFAKKNKPILETCKNKPEFLLMKKTLTNEKAEN
jgi:hypothetical protein